MLSKGAILPQGVYEEISEGKGLIKTIKQLIQKLQIKGFRLSRRVIEEVLNQAGENL